MYDRSAEFYDAIYSFKNYKKETARLHELIQQYKRSPGNELLDVACGTGGHIAYLKRNYSVEGLDISPLMLRLARNKHPDVVFYHRDMTNFKLRKKFDVVTCLFSAIGHVKTRRRLDLAVRAMARHLKPGGVLVVESWPTPKQWQIGRLGANFVDEANLKIARFGISKARGRLSVQDLHHLVATPNRIQHFVESTHDEYLDTFRQAKLETVYDPEGLMGRGLYIGTRPVDH
ncbi:MAG TPA: class I SAM-dependent methyltransferase [Candidatus Bathyarchaeia archaeon]|nr:class I SAM-dependent methyltransferase [Candidatus Bathyarchaeia archaeon]